MSEPEYSSDQAELSAENKEKLEKLVQKDSRSGRVFSGYWKYITSAMGVFMVFFYMYCAAVPVDTQYFLGVYVMLTYVMALLIYPLKASSPSHRPTVVDLLMAAAAVFVVGYFVMEYEAINYRMGSETPMDTFVSALGILVSLEVARRALGWSMTIVGTVFLCYAFWGDLLQNVPLLNAFAHTGFKIDRAINHIYYKQEGVFGIMATVLVTYVILFIFFGSFLKASGASRFFIDVPMAVAGKSIGGPAKVAVIASGFFGSVSGSAIANTVSTGAFTIPMMKKAGFRPHVAGAIEPSASIGGMFMPPIMGAGGFLMAEMTEIPYVKIMIMAVFPALIYFLSVYTMVHFEAKRYGIVGKRQPGDPTAMEILKKQWFMSLPLVIIVVMMIVGFSPGYAAFWAIISCIGVSWFTPDNKMGMKQILDAMIEGANATLIIGATVGVIGIIVGTIQLTGIGLKFSQIIIDLSFGSLPVAILLVGLASLVLGMGVPVTAAYLITAVLAVGALTDMISQSYWGVSFRELQLPLGQLLADDPQRLEIMAKVSWALIASHMVVYWFSQDSNITPPVCVAAYAGAAIAGSDPWKTGWTSFKFAKMLYIGPLLFVYSPGFLLGGPGHFVPWYQVASTLMTVILGTVAFGALSMGYFLCGFTIKEWIICAFATIFLFFPHLVNWIVFGIDLPTILVDMLGIGMWVIVFFMQKIRIKKDPTLVLPIDERRRLMRAKAAQAV